MHAPAAATIGALPETPQAEAPQRAQELRKAKDRQESLLRRTPAGSGFSWMLERQIMFHGRQMYVNNGPTNTMPSHDLAHLLVGMTSDLPWRPTGADAEVRISEFNAAVLENLLSYAYEHVVCRSVRLEDVVPKTLQYAKWFVEKHYAPFPIPFTEAYRRFCLGINVDPITNLSHYFFSQKDAERRDIEHKGPWEMRLIHRPPVGLDGLTQQYQLMIRMTLQMMKARPNDFAAFL